MDPHKSTHGYSYFGEKEYPDEDLPSELNEDEMDDILDLSEVSMQTFTVNCNEETTNSKEKAKNEFRRLVSSSELTIVIHSIEREDNKWVISFKYTE